MDQRKEPAGIKKTIFVWLTVAFAAAAAVCTLLINLHDRHWALQEAKIKAMILLDQNQSLLSFFRDEVRAKVLDMHQGVSPDTFDPVLMSSFYAIRRVNERHNQIDPMTYRYKICAIDARTLEDEADPYEAEVIRAFDTQADLREHSALRSIDGIPYYVIMRPGTKVNQSCMRCHSSPEVAPKELVASYGDERGFHWPIDHVVSASSIRIPVAEAFHEANMTSAKLSIAFAGVLLVLYFVLASLGKRLIFNPLNEVNMKAIEISGSFDEHLGEEIPLPPGKELREFTSSFNAMSKALRRDRDLLEDRVEQRTRALKTATEELETEIVVRKKAEEEIREREMWMTGMFNALQECVLILTPEGKIVNMNPAGEAIFGYTLEELLNTSTEVLHIDREHYDAFCGRLEEAFAQGKAAFFDSEARRKNGEIFPSEQTVSMLKKENNVPLGILSVIRDTTALRAAEKALRSSEATLRGILDAAKESIWLFSPDGFVLMANETALLRYYKPAAELIGKHFSELLQAELAQSRLEQLRKTVRLKRVVEFEDHRGGIDFHHTFYPVMDATERVTSVACFSRDITEGKRAEAERLRLEEHLRQTRKAESLARMAGAIAHHFNNMLGAAIGNLELALDESSQGTELDTYIREAMKASQRAATISRYMLTYLGQTTRNIERLDPAESLREACGLLNPSLPGNVQVKAELPSQGPPVHADAAHLAQILNHLLVNSIEAIGDRKGEIDLSITVVSGSELGELRLFPSGWEPKAAEYACIAIADTGYGIDRENLDKVFDPFFSTKFTGRGLGLSIVTGLLRSMEGAISVESSRGIGTTFKVFLPVVE